MEGNTVLGIAGPEEHRAEDIRHLVACPMFAQDVHWDLRSRDVPEVEDIGSDSFANSVAGECGPSLTELGMRDSAAGDNGFVVSKHDWPANRDTEAVQCQTEINDPISGSAGGHDLGTTRGGFDRVLLFAVEINDGLIYSMDNAGDGSAGDNLPVHRASDI